MKLQQRLSQLSSFALTLGVLAGTTPVHSAELDISDVPLFLDSGVDPNILMVIDDSGSMDWLAVFSKEAQVAHPSETNPANYKDRATDPGAPLPYTGDFHIAYQPTTDAETRMLCNSYNVLAYDQSRTYTPWEGKDINGSDYANVTSVSSALIDPYRGTASSSNRVNISSHYYFNWVDGDGDQKYDSGECPTLPAQQSTTTTTYYCKEWNRWYEQYDPSEGYNRCRRKKWNGDWKNEWRDMWSNSTTVTEPFADACTRESQCFVVNDLTAAEKQNYANWYSYYRKREFVAKKATLALIDSSSARMGLGTLNDNNNVGTTITDMDDGDSSTTADATNKATLMSEVGQINSNSGTPLRASLKEAGEYYESGSRALFEHMSSDPGTPILSASNGGQCQQNFTILMTDGYASSSTSPNVGNRDNDGGTDDDGDDSIYDGGIYADTVSNTIADVAMKFYEKDLSTLSDAVPNSNGQSDKMHQHMITYTVAFGVEGNLSCQPGSAGCSSSWPTSIDYDGSDPNSIDDLWHAAVNGRGQYLNAAEPQDLIDDMQEALDSIDARNSGSAAVAANSTTLNQGTVIYQALFNTGDWHGNLRSLPVSIGSTDTRSSCAGVSAGFVCNAADWNASTQLDAQNPDTGRNIMTYNSASTNANKGIAFRWPTNHLSPTAFELSSSQITDLLDSAPTGNEANYGSALIDFLRGNQSNEGTGFSFRERNSTVFGDIVNSAPAYVGAPALNYPDNLEVTAYSTYKEGSASSRTPVVYVGANDGMLHGFNTETGNEVVAYVPEAVYGNLDLLSKDEYTTQSNHRYFVDGSPTVGDAFLSGAWKTVLVSGLRAGGQSVFALNVTDPTKFTETQGDINQVVMWEFTDTDLGYTYSQPDIVKMNDGTWAAIFGNGYNNTEADGDASTTGYGYLYIVNLQTGALIKKISTNTGNTTTPNGLATATPVDTNGDYKVDYIYAGDLQGNMWKFDVSSTSSSSWDVVKSGGTPTPIFTAKAPETGYPSQPITTRPSVSFHPDPAQSGLLVLFGTGRYIDTVDNVASGQNTQTFYAVWDKLDGTFPASFNGNRTNSNYLRQTILSENIVGTSGAVVRTTSNNTVDWTTHHGWYLDLVNTGSSPQDNLGERQVTNSVLRGGRIVFTTLSPNDVACDFGGSSWLMEIDLGSGSRLAESPLDINNDGDIDDNDLYNSNVISGIQQSGIITEPSIVGSADDDKEYKLFNSSTGSTITITETPPDGSGAAASRNSWTEITQ
ncbi:MAG: pilus assembly protein [Cellvibrionaceae bacterium]